MSVGIFFYVACLEKTCCFATIAILAKARNGLFCRNLMLPQKEKDFGLQCLMQKSSFVFVVLYNRLARFLKSLARVF